MKLYHHRLSLTCVVLISTLAFLNHANAQLRIVTYNTATSGDNQAPTNPRAGISTILEAIGDESTGGIAKPIDVLLLQEQDSSASTTQAIVNLMNDIYGSGTYARATLNGATFGAGSPGLVYRTDSIQLLQQTTVGTTSGSGAPRQGLRYRVRPVGYDASADFYLYNNHYKASSTATDQARRLVEAINVRNNADALGNGEHIIYAGDFNIRSSNEDSYQELLSAGNGQAFDPISRPGNWNNNSSFRDIHTQSPYNPSFNDPTLVSGGLDDRFDFQLTSGEFLDNEGLSYINGSYHAFGNNGSHSLNDFINDNSNTALPDNVLDALASASDHLPVVADYQLPASMSVSIGSFADRVLPGAILQAPVTVTNVADVVAVNGADELDYSITTTGVPGVITGTDQPLGGGMLHNVSVETATPGVKNGTIDVVSSSQSVANGSFTGNLNYTVLNHANASFDTSVDQNSQTVDFGFVGSCDSVSQTITVANLFDAIGAGLDLDSVLEFGDTAAFANDFASFTNLASGDSESFELTFDAPNAASGDHTATYVLQLTDEDVPGIQLGEGLTLTVTGAVTLPGDANLDGFVDASDFNVWNANSFTAGNVSFTDGDFNCDNVVDGSDFNIWNANKFTSLDRHNSSGPNTVPEPSGMLLALVGLVSVLKFRRR